MQSSKMNYVQPNHIILIEPSTKLSARAQNFKDSTIEQLRQNRIKKNIQRYTEFQRSEPSTKLSSRAQKIRDSAFEHVRQNRLKKFHKNILY